MLELFSLSVLALALAFPFRGTINIGSLGRRLGVGTPDETETYPLASEWSRVPNGPVACRWVDPFTCPIKMAVNWGAGRGVCADTVAAEEARTTAAATNENNELEEGMLLWKAEG